MHFLVGVNTLVFLIEIIGGYLLEVKTVSP